jgi:uncharacterized protein DUF4190
MTTLPPPYARTTSTLAIVAFVCAVVGIWPAAIPLGIMGQREIDRSGGRLTGRGLATAGLVIGIIGAVLTVVMIVLIVSTVGSSGPGVQFQFTTTPTP